MLHLSHMQKEMKLGIDLRERDFAVLRGLYESRVMHIGQLAKLYFEERLEAARKRVQKLKGANLIGDRIRGYSEPTALQLTKLGYEALKRFGQFEGLPVLGEAAFSVRNAVSSLTLRHELAVVDVRIALERALLKHPGVRKIHCSTWPLLSAFTTRQPAVGGYGSSEIMVKPDGFLSITYQDGADIMESLNFLELDLGTESLKVLAAKMVAYRAHYRSGGFAESRGGTREQIEHLPFRVLVVFKSAERRNNCAEQLLRLDPPIKTMVWLTTMAEVSIDLLGTIWLRPSEYQSSLAQCKLDYAGRHESGKYRRQMERDGLVERLVLKHALLDA